MSALVRHYYTVSKINVACCNCNFKFLVKKSLKRVRAIQIEFEFGSVTLVLKENGKPEYPEINLSEQGREPSVNSTHKWCRRRDLNPGHIGGR